MHATRRGSAPDWLILIAICHVGCLADYAYAGTANVSFLVCSLMGCRRSALPPVPFYGPLLIFLFYLCLCTVLQGQLRFCSLWRVALVGDSIWRDR